MLAMRFIALGCVAALSLAGACTSTPAIDLPTIAQTTVESSATTSQPPVAPLHAPLPKNGWSSISGTLYSYTIDSILPDTMFYLTRAIGQDKTLFPPILTGPDEDAGDIRAFTDDNGQFALDNVPPDSYFLITWAPYNWVPAEVSPGSQSPRLIKLEAGQSEALGVLYLSWP